MEDELPSNINDIAIVVKGKSNKLSCLCSLTAELHLAPLRVAHKFNSWHGLCCQLHGPSQLQGVFEALCYRGDTRYSAWRRVKNCYGLQLSRWAMTSHLQLTRPDHLLITNFFTCLSGKKTAV